MNPITLRNLTTSLLLNKTNANSNVFNSRVTALPPSALPAICVFFRSVEAEQLSPSRIAFSENGIIEIDVMAASSTSWADTVDLIIEQVKNTLFSSQEWLDAVGLITSYSVNYHIPEINNTEIPTVIAAIQINIKKFNIFNPI